MIIINFCTIIIIFISQPSSQMRYFNFLSIMFLNLIVRKSYSLLSLNSYKNNILHKNNLVNNIIKRKLSSLSEITNTSLNKKDTQFVFVGGKGGVGKTTTSSAIALSCSDNQLRTLIVSTDPAHSLGDALDIDLSSGKVTPIVTESNLWALEIDVDAALEEFKDILRDFDSETIAKNLGIPKNIIDSFGIDEIADIFANPPPGIDEIVALTKIFQYTNDKKSKNQHSFDRIIIDTAPTGHTLRLLQLPEFLNSFTGRLLKFRAKINNALDSFKSMFGGGNVNANEESPSDKLKNILNKLDNLQENILLVKSSLKDPEKTQFVAVTIPTSLAVAETKRLVSSLQCEEIKVSTMICNQVVSTNINDLQYMKTRSNEQRKSITKLMNTIDQINKKAATKEGSGSSSSVIEVTEVPFVDTEVTGIYGLRFFHSIAHKPIPHTATNPIDSRKLTIFGGKGGVGKTTSAASWAVRLADSGFKTLVVSSDPAHSLGDALQERLTGIPTLLDRNPIEGGQLWGLEIDPVQGLEEFQNLIQTTLASNNGMNDNNSGSFMSSLGLPNLSNELGELLSGIKEPPPGTDEIIALTKIISFLDNGYILPDGNIIKFDRIVLDTAPTGHTLRMLQLPQFLQKLIIKIKKIKEKTDSISGNNNINNMNNNNDKLLEFQNKMKRLETVLHSSKDCEFTGVTIPTELATSETLRLLSALKDENILVRRVIINQILPILNDNDIQDTISTYLTKVRNGQNKSIQELQILSKNSKINLIQVPFYDMEVRTVYGLRVISKAIFN